MSEILGQRTLSIHATTARLMLEVQHVDFNFASQKRLYSAKMMKPDLISIRQIVIVIQTFLGIHSPQHIGFGINQQFGKIFGLIST